jgi:hypothetical protein
MQPPDLHTSTSGTITTISGHGDQDGEDGDAATPAATYVGASADPPETRVSAEFRDASENPALRASPRF